MFARTPQPKHSIWGYVQSAEQIMPGVWHVSTAGHGGLIISHERKNAMPLRNVRTFSGATLSYEEDCDWTLVALSFPEEFEAATRVGIIAEARAIAVQCWPAVVAALEREKK